jgi:hypothetical protein
VIGKKNDEGSDKGCDKGCDRVRKKCIGLIKNNE